MGTRRRDGPWRPLPSTTNQHFYSELAQRVIKATSQLGGQGRLYEVDARLRPTGKSGTLATTFDELVRYYLEGDGQLWERQALCKARLVYGSPALPNGRCRRGQGRLRTPVAAQTRRWKSATCGGGWRTSRSPAT